jgi:hypothetical protein
MVLPVARQNIDRWFTVGLLGVWVLIAVIQQPGWPMRLSRPFYLIPLWLAYASYQAVRVETDLRLIGGYVLFLAAALIYDYYRKDHRALVILTLTGILSFLGGAVMSIRILLVNPMAARLISTNGVGIAEYRDLSHSGVGDYRFTYGVALLLPFLVAISARAGRSLRLRLASSVCACFFAYYLYLATFAMSIYIMIAGTIIVLFYHIKLRRAKLMASLVLIAAGMVFLSSLGADLMSLISRNIKSPVLSTKASAIASFISGEKDAVSLAPARATLDRTSFDTFLDHPIIGVGSYYNIPGDDIALEHGIGSHSELFDTLARYGLVGVIIYLFIFLPLTFRAASEWKGTAYANTALAMWILLLLMYSSNVVSGLSEIGVTVLLLWPALPNAFAARGPVRLRFRLFVVPSAYHRAARRTDRGFDTQIGTGHVYQGPSRTQGPEFTPGL